MESPEVRLVTEAALGRSLKDEQFKVDNRVMPLFRGELPHNTDIDQISGFSWNGAWRLRAVNSYPNLPIDLGVQAGMIEIYQSDILQATIQRITHGDTMIYREFLGLEDRGDWQKVVTEKNISTLDIPVRRNLARNPRGRFVDGEISWLKPVSATTLTEDSSTGAVRVTRTAGTTSEIQIEPAPHIDMSIGEKIRMRIEVMPLTASVANRIAINLGFFEENTLGEPEIYSPTPNLTVGEWGWIEWERTLIQDSSTGVTYGRPRIWLRGTANPDDAFLVRRVLVEKGYALSSDASYFDGNEAPSGSKTSWAGEPNASESVLTMKASDVFAGAASSGPANAVSSTDIRTMRTTTDPNEIAAPGELLIVLEV